MIRRLILAFALVCAAGAARAQCVLPFTLLPHTLADATQVMANFNAVNNCIQAVFPSPWTMTASNIAIGPLDTLAALTIKKTGTAQPNPIEITSYNQLLLGNPFQQLPWLTCNPVVSWTLCSAQGPILRTYGDLCCGDLESFGAMSEAQLQGVQYGVRLTNSEPGGPTVLLSSEGAPQTDVFGGAHLEVYADCVACGGPGSYTYLGPTNANIAHPGSGYAVNDTITLADGCSASAVLRVYAVNDSGGVTGAVTDRGQGGICASQHASGPVGQSATDRGGSPGPGTAFQITALAPGPNSQWQAPPFAGLQGTAQIISYDSLGIGHQVINFDGRSGPGALATLAQITEIQTSFMQAVHIKGANPSDAVNTLALGFDSGTNSSTFFSYGPNTGTAGAFQFAGLSSDHSLTTVDLTLVGGGAVLGSGALGTTATNGFLYIASGPGPPTGVPTSFTGRVPFYYDSTNDQLYIYRGGWKQPKTPGAAAIVSWQ